MAQMPVSLEKPIGEEEDSSLGDFVPDDQAESPFDTASLSLRRGDIEQALAALPERERKVIELRFGLLGEPPCTLEEVGRAFGVTRERIRQIENNTLKKPRDPPRGAAAPRLRLIVAWGAPAPPARLDLYREARIRRAEAQPLDPRLTAGHFGSQLARSRRHDWPPVCHGSSGAVTPSAFQAVGRSRRSSPGRSARRGDRRAMGAQRRVQPLRATARIARSGGEQQGGARALGFLRRVIVAIVAAIAVWSSSRSTADRPDRQRTARVERRDRPLRRHRLQHAALDVGSGLLVAFAQPLRLGDRVTIGEHTGFVEEVDCSTPTLVTDEARRVFVPNRQLTTSTIVNGARFATRGGSSRRVPGRLGASVDEARQVVLRAVSRLEGERHDERVARGRREGRRGRLTATVSAPLDADVILLGSNLREEVLDALGEAGALAA